MIDTEWKDNGFLVGIQSGRVIVYEADTQQVYEYTDIDAAVLQKLHPSVYQDLLKNPANLKMLVERLPLIDGNTNKITKKTARMQKIQHERKKRHAAYCLSEHFFHQLCKQRHLFFGGFHTLFSPICTVLLPKIYRKI